MGTTMKVLWIMAVMARLQLGPVHASVHSGTNNLPEQFRTLMETAGYPLDHHRHAFPLLSTNSPGYWQFSPPGPFRPLVVPVKKSGWTLWDNASIKRVGRIDDQASLLSHYEYDISYSFDF